MVQLQKKRLRTGFELEAANNQLLPEEVIAIAQELPLTTRVTFLQVIHEGKRIPQEIISLGELLGTAH